MKAIKYHLIFDTIIYINVVFDCDDSIVEI